MEWKVKAIRGATTASENTVDAIREAVTELLTTLESYNQIDTDQIISATFSVTRDLDATFPAAIARERSHWQDVPMIDLQQMHVEGSLERCIRVLIHLNVPEPALPVHHTYLRRASNLRPDWDLAKFELDSRTSPVS
ncbi:MAG: chorismate mutase [Cyanobacteria bacterium P01_A01_bin.135]